jgi:hypothetical protein
METQNNLPSPTAIKRFVRDTARGIKNDFITAEESLDDFLDLDPQSSPQEAGESIQITIRKNEKAKERLVTLAGFIQKLRKAEELKTIETQEEVAAAFAKLKSSLESPDSTAGMLS